MAIETDSPSIPTIEESEVGRGRRLFDIMVKWVGGGCVLERGCLFEKKRYSQGYLDYIHKYIVLSTHKKPRNSLVSVLFGQSRDLKGLVLITLLCSYLARYA